MNTVQNKVAEQIAAIAPQVENSVVNVLVEREVNKRSTALVKVIDELNKLEAQLKKIKPDINHFDSNGNVVAEAFSKAKLDEKKKLVEKIGKYTNAINKALEKGEFGDVYNLGNQNSSGNTGSSEASSETAE